MCSAEPLSKVCRVKFWWNTSKIPHLLLSPKMIFFEKKFQYFFNLRFKRNIWIGRFGIVSRFWVFWGVLRLLHPGVIQTMWTFELEMAPSDWLMPHSHFIIGQWVVLPVQISSSTTPNYAYHNTQSTFRRENFSTRKLSRESTRKWGLLILHINKKVR